MDASMLDLAFHAGDLVGLFVVVAVIWTKLDAIKEAFQDHKKQDDDRHEETGKAIHKLRSDVQTVTNRVATIQGRLER